MARPFQQLGIVGLEDLFVKSEGELQVLRDLEYELRHRQVPRARSLMRRAQGVVARQDRGCCYAEEFGLTGTG